MANRQLNNTTPEEEVYLYWFACRVMGLAIRKGRQNTAMKGLRGLYRIIGKKYMFRTREEMAIDIRNLGERLEKRLANSQPGEQFKLLGAGAMRINIYSQELTKEVKLVSKVADTGILYYGVRIYLASPDILHYSPEDDDRSAITFWIPNARSFTNHDLGDVFQMMSIQAHTAPDPGLASQPAISDKDGVL